MSFSGRDINLDVLRVQGYRFFCNKLWNATRFAMMYLGSGYQPDTKCILNLFKQKEESKVAFEHRPIPTESDIKSKAVWHTLDSCLKDSAFLSGTQASKVDVEVFKLIAESPSFWQYRNLCQWWHSMNAMTDSERNSLPGGVGILAPQPAALTKMDRWILSRLREATVACNEGLSSYNFPQATTALYNFWLYELCDVYLEYLKPVFQGSNVRAILTARHVLYLCLDGALRLISPFMPFISEELFQRLPRKSDSEPPSIMVTRYPEAKDYPFKDDELKAQVEFVQKVVGTVRSTRSDYNLPNKTKTDLYLAVFDKKLSQDLEPFAGVIGTLAYSSKVEITSQPPAGCAIVTVSDKCSAHLMLKGLIDPAKEVEKLSKKKSGLESQLDKLKKATSIKGYEEKVPEEVRLANKEKLEQTITEIARLTEAIEVLKLL